MFFECIIDDNLLSVNWHIVIVHKLCNWSQKHQFSLTCYVREDCIMDLFRLKWLKLFTALQSNVNKRRKLLFNKILQSKLIVTNFRPSSAFSYVKRDKRFFTQIHKSCLTQPKIILFNKNYIIYVQTFMKVKAVDNKWILFWRVINNLIFWSGIFSHDLRLKFVMKLDISIKRMLFIISSFEFLRN